jgi:hypothetical protein
MKDLSFYEQVGIVLPGAVLLLGALFLTPELRSLFMDGGISVGGLGLFLIVAYALGHLVAAAGNLLEWAVWLTCKGMPSEWVVRKHWKLLPPAQISQVESKVKKRLGIDVDLSNTSRKDWRPIFRRLFADVRTIEPEGMNLTFNGNYGLNRGMATAMFVVAVGCALRHAPGWERWTAAFAVVGLVYVYRMCRFGIFFARYVYDRFVQLPDAVEAPKQA